MHTHCPPIPHRHCPHSLARLLLVWVVDERAGGAASTRQSINSPSPRFHRENEIATRPSTAPPAHCADGGAGVGPRFPSWERRAPTPDGATATEARCVCTYHGGLEAVLLAVEPRAPVLARAAHEHLPLFRHLHRSQACPLRQHEPRSVTTAVRLRSWHVCSQGLRRSGFIYAVQLMLDAPSGEVGKRGDERRIGGRCRRQHEGTRASQRLRPFGPYEASDELLGSRGVLMDEALTMAVCR